MSDRFRIQLTKDFWLHEFLKSETAARMGRKLEPDEIIIANIQELCVRVLQPLRDDIGRSMVISSGWRPDWLNEAIGGSKRSQHMDGLAANCNAIGQMKLPYDQLILEFDDWMHISIPTGWSAGAEPRSQELTARWVDGKVLYMNGLIES
jgi:hypothetical protein